MGVTLLASSPHLFPLLLFSAVHPASDQQALAIDQVHETSAALSWAMDHIHEYGGNPSRIFLTGHSSGAHVYSMVVWRRFRSRALEQLAAVSADAAASLRPTLPPSNPRNASSPPSDQEASSSEEVDPLSSDCFSSRFLAPSSPSPLDILRQELGGGVAEAVVAALCRANSACSPPPPPLPLFLLPPLSPPRLHPPIPPPPPPPLLLQFPLLPPSLPRPLSSPSLSFSAVLVIM
ncbi:unnamed protein product [Closterium sp. Naga37s-1]|nr:unnamed protein product [Closterium sp. Naga37s-1]